MNLMFMIAALVLYGPLGPQMGATTARCNVVSFTASLEAGHSFNQKVGGLEFKLRATNDKRLCNGWWFSLEDAGGHDFIYPLNLPLRFNPSQFLGCSYGLTVRQGLEMKRSLQFILTEEDYARLGPRMSDALWLANSPDPEHAGEKYLAALRTVRAGLIQLNTTHFDLSPNGLIRSATFRVKLTAPDRFQFDPALKPYSTACPATPAQ